MATMQQTAAELRERVECSLREQGFQILDGAVTLPPELSKDSLRRLHATAVEHRKDRAKGGLHRKEPMLLGHLASGCEISPSEMAPRLVEVLPGTIEELLFRYASLHWSIPVSSGYGRRLRFIVVDDYNDKLIGLIGLGDPVYSLGARDQWIGWNAPNRQAHLRNVMDAFVLGAVPPYSLLLGGKLIAMLLTSETVSKAFRKKYGGSVSRIRQKTHDGNLALITTTSALGRSSIYNRLRFHDELLFQSVGYTKGSGEFHFTNGLYGAISEFAQQHSTPTEKQASWGNGFRNRREVIKKSLPAIGLSSRWLYHGVKREIFVVPLAHNTREFLRGEESALKPITHSEGAIFDYFRERWLLPRASRDQRFKDWTRDDWMLWQEEGG